MLVRNLIFVIAFSCQWIGVAKAQKVVDSLLKVLDDRIEHKEEYFGAKEQRIRILKAQKDALKRSPNEDYILNRALYNEYKNYVSDSAILYLNQNMEIGERLQDQDKISEASIESASLFVRLGMYKEAEDLLKKIGESSLSLQWRLAFLKGYRSLYLGLGEHSQNSRIRYKYWQNAKLYDDSIRELISKDSEEFLAMQEKQYRLDSAFEKALQVNEQRLALVEPFSNEYAYITFLRALIYRLAGQRAHEKEYLALSAISDVQQANKDNASISILARRLMDDGDINRAYKYIRFSLENIKDYNTRIRSSDVLNIQTIIDKQYQSINLKKKRELTTLLTVVSVLSALLIVSIALVYKHMKKSQAFGRKLKENLQALETFNHKLFDMNSELKERNLEVAEANHIKEEYIVYLLDECSNYIAKLDDYRDMVNKKVRARQYEELYSITRDSTLKDEEYKLLFANFDAMFVNLFPDFISELNKLFVKEEQIVLKKGEILNTELRILALIRLGITDSSKIAKFLGYSVNTIYNYRTKMKNKLKGSRDDFEQRVKKIGGFS